MKFAKLHQSEILELLDSEVSTCVETNEGKINVLG